MGSPDSMQSIVAAPSKTVARLLRNVDTGKGDSNDLVSAKEERAGAQLQFIDDLLAKLAINEAVALQNLNRFDDELMQKLRENPTWMKKIQSWKENDLDPTDVANILKQYPLSRKHSMEWNAWKIYAAQYLRLSQGLS
ncbi:hypothetical protein F444_23003 [Phytophthora nicotianae P1976]|uniref:RxLR effector protein n=1 Tax=Phytophthora nicotianae P1976 TaxID=1317066 RepID=A0A080YW58_PHYNI|nr:hypothetical protein F444_23003 [Phytophthora nicotianae P1976]